MNASEHAARDMIPGAEEVPAISVQKFNLWYGDFQALYDVDFDVREKQVTALIGPSGCGKSTLLRSINRITERLGYVRTNGRIEVLGKDILATDVEPARLRKEVGMVFQRPNPLPISIRDNILFGHNLHMRGKKKKDEKKEDDEEKGAKNERKQKKEEKEHIVEEALREVLLWDSVKDRLKMKATHLSLEEQQKLCIARLLPVQPAVLLMDEPCSALDPKATAAVEELIWGLREKFTILIVTHNMAQARRASDECAFMLMGKMVEMAPTEQMFVTPGCQEAADYIEGRYG